ncbi:Cache 3/Cache 2 fusion domain-containing protein, partial [Pseudothermotoga sp.]|uniref:Cache 3/Cache 2 fusion domain-containing protein n=1 Tax=Pseudothermotoga sp. TaxID=2033661 RepID=UPI0031F6C95B
MKLSLRTYGVILVISVSLIALIPISLIAFKSQRNITQKITNELYLNTLNGAINVLKEYVKQEYGTIRLESGVLVDSSGRIIRGRFEAVDKISQHMNVVATIFQKEGDDFLRVSTSIKKEDGSRAVGTFLGKDSAAYKPIVQKQRYIGEAKILGAPYATVYDPILDQNGNLIGILFVGVPKSIIDASISSSQKEFFKNILITAAAVFAFAFIVGFVFVNTVLIKAVKKFSAILEKVKDGDLSFETNEKFSSKEFAQLFETVNGMKSGLIKLVSNISA